MSNAHIQDMFVTIHEIIGLAHAPDFIRAEARASLAVIRRAYESALNSQETKYRISRSQRRQFARDNLKQPIVLQEVPRDKWPNQTGSQLRVFRSRDFLVQEFTADAPATVRLSVCRTARQGDRWKDGITWDDLQRIKHECGYGTVDAIEIYPTDADTVNVANMRHLWVMAEPIMCAWRTGGNNVTPLSPLHTVDR